MSNGYIAQVGGDHYDRDKSGLQHWDLMELLQVPYLEGNASKYLARWRLKNGLVDLQKALSYVSKLATRLEAQKTATKWGPDERLWSISAPRQPRSRLVIGGDAGAETRLLMEFCVRQQMGPITTSAFLSITQWRTLGDVAQAERLIHRLIDDVRRGVIDGEVNVSAARQEHPRGFDPVQDTV